MHIKNLARPVVAVVACLLTMALAAPVASAGIGPQLPSTTDSGVFIYEPEGDAVIEVVATAVWGPFGACPPFPHGVAGIGPALPVNHGDYVTMCVSVRNVGPRTAHGVVVELDGAAAPVGDLGSLYPGEEATISIDVEASAFGPSLFVFSAAGTGYYATLITDADPAAIEVQPILAGGIGEPCLRPFGC